MQEPPLRAVLVGPGAPRLREVGLVVESLVVGRVLLVEGGVGCEDGGDVVLLDVVDEIEHRGCEGGYLVCVAAGGEELADGCGGVGGCVVDQDRRGDVVAVFVEGRVVDVWVPVAALPAADWIGEDLGEVVVVGDAGETKGALQLGDVLSIVA